MMIMLKLRRKHLFPCNRIIFTKENANTIIECLIKIYATVLVSVTCGGASSNHTMLKMFWADLSRIKIF